MTPRASGRRAPASVDLVARRTARTPMRPRDGGRLVDRRRRRSRHGDALRRSRSTAATPRPDPRGARGCRTGRTAVGRGRRPSAFAWTDDAWRGVAAAQGRSSTSCTSARSPPRARSTPPIERLDHLVDARRRRGRAAAARDVPRPARLGLRRRRAVRRARAVRRPGRPAALRRRRARPRPRRLPRRRLQPPRPGRELPRRVRAVLHRHARHAVGRRRSTSTARTATRCGAGCVDNALHVAARLPRRRAAARRGARAARRRARCTLLEELSREVDALAARLGRPLWLIAESDRNDPRTVTPRGEARRARAARAVGRRRAPRAARRADRRDAGLLRRLRRPRGALRQGAATRAFFHDGTYSTLPRPAARPAGRPAPRARAGGSSSSLQTHDQVGNRAQGDRLSRSLDPRPARLRCRAPADLAVHADAVHGRGVGRHDAVAVLHRPHRPRHRRGHARGRKAEFGTHGWDERDVPDPQDPETFRRSRLDWSEPAAEPHARLLALVPRPDRAAPAEPDLRDPRLDRVDVTWADRRLDMTRGASRCW